MRGPGPSEMTKVKVDNQVAFCRVTSQKQKEEIERRLLQSRISYFARQEERSFWGKLFSGKGSEAAFIICIHTTVVDEARELLKDMQDIKILA